MSNSLAKKVLVIKMSSLGDVLHALPAVTDAANHGFEVDWVVEEAFADIPAAHPGVRRVLPIAWRRWRRRVTRNTPEMRAFVDMLRDESYDLILDAQGLIKSAVVACLAKGPRSGFSFTTAREPWAAFAYDQGHRISTNQHAIDRQRQLFAAALNYALPSGFDSGLNAPKVSSNEIYLLHGTTWETKHWPVAMWQALADLIAADGFVPVVTWGDDLEKQRALDIASAGHVLVQERLPLHQIAMRLARAAAVVGVDSGLCHYSAALGTPTLGVYGPTSGALTGCRGAQADVLQASVACSPCLAKQCRNYTGEPLLWKGDIVQPPCFATVQPAMVWRRVKSMMEAGGADNRLT